MVKKAIYTVIVLATLSIGITFSKNASNKPSMGRVVFSELGLSLQVEIAETEKQRAQGLMHRSFLASNKGMLFVFDQVGIQRVWMKNTPMALDIVFLSEEGRVVSTLQNLQPCLQQPCKVYPSNKEAKYMLELNAGMIKRTGIKDNQKIVFDRL
jgi:uncharacterized membrane protein (UPF0127 family)